MVGKNGKEFSTNFIQTGEKEYNVGEVGGQFLSDAHFLDLVSAHESMFSHCACVLRRSFMGEP